MHLMKKLEGVWFYRAVDIPGERLHVLDPSNDTFQRRREGKY